jgi:hypothetical protein
MTIEKFWYIWELGINVAVDKSTIISESKILILTIKMQHDSYTVTVICGEPNLKGTHPWRLRHGKGWWDGHQYFPYSRYSSELIVPAITTPQEILAAIFLASVESDNDSLVWNRSSHAARSASSKRCAQHPGSLDTN